MGAVLIMISFLNWGMQRGMLYMYSMSEYFMKFIKKNIFFSCL